MLSTVFEQDKIVPSTQKNFRARDTVAVFLSAGNNPGVLKNSTGHSEPLFITCRQFLINVTSHNRADYQYGFRARLRTNQTERILLRIVSFKTI